MEDVELETTQGPSEAERVSSWRLDVLLDAGYPQELAEAVEGPEAAPEPVEQPKHDPDTCEIRSTSAED